MRIVPALLLAAVAATAAPASAAGLKAAIHAGYDDVDGGGGSGVALGFDLGYDAPLGPLAFIGAVGTFNSSTSKACQTVAAGRACVSADDEYGAVGRIGAALPFGPRAYVLGGGSRLRIKERLTSGAAIIEDKDWRSGYLIGAGVEMPVALFGYTKLEYRHGNYDRGISRDQVLIGAGIEF